jgi:hypothetical protein
MKYLFYCWVTPYDKIDEKTVVKNNLISGNSGNLLFLDAVIKSIDVSQPESAVYTLRDKDKHKECDMFVIPLANIFRKNNGNVEMKNLTQFVESLSIPTVVVGCGCQSRTGTILRRRPRFSGRERDSA